MTIIFRNPIQDGMKFYYPCQIFHPMISWEVCTNWEYVSLYDMEIHQKISMPNYQTLKTMVYISETSITKLWRQTRENWKQEQWSRMEREWVALKEVKVPVTSGKKKCQSSQGDRCSFRHGTEDREQKPEHTAATPSEPSMSRGRRCVEEEKYRRQKVTMGPFFDKPCRCYLKGTCTRTLYEYCHPPECQFY